MNTDYYAGLIDDVYGLDPGFFMLAPEDAQAMDPQALVLLEESLKAVYDAGYSEQDINSSATGIYIGARSQPLEPLIVMTSPVMPPEACLTA